MRTNIVLDDALIEKAFKCAQVKSKKELIHLALEEFVRNHNRKDLSDLRGKIRFADDYDHKQLRRGHWVILVDTSVMIDFLRGRPAAGADKLGEIIAKKLPYGINIFIYQELLQGAATDKDFSRLKEYLDTLVFYDLKQGRESHAEAARLYLRCRQAGYTVASTLDCLIALTALENNLLLLHNDRDFEHIRKVAKNLQFF